MFGREVAAAIYAVTGNLDTAALKMAWASDTTPVPAWLSAQVKNMSAGGLQIDNYVWEGCEDALIAGSGNPQVRAGVLRLVSVLPGITVTHGTVDGQPTLTLTAGAAELGPSGIDKANPKAETGRPPGGDHHQRRHRHPAEDRRRHGGQRRRHRHLRGDPGQPGRHRRRQVLTGRIDQRSPARPHLAGDRPLPAELIACWKPLGVGGNHQQRRGRARHRDTRGAERGDVQTACITACSTWRFPITGPQRRVTAACAASNEARAASSVRRPVRRRRNTTASGRPGGTYTVTCRRRRPRAGWHHGRDGCGPCGRPGGRRRRRPRWPRRVRLSPGFRIARAHRACGAAGRAAWRDRVPRRRRRRSARLRRAGAWSRPEERPR